jgi:hypothetical protein
MKTSSAGAADATVGVHTIGVVCCVAVCSPRHTGRLALHYPLNKSHRHAVAPIRQDICHVEPKNQPTSCKAATKSRSMYAVRVPV